MLTAHHRQKLAAFLAGEGTLTVAEVARLIPELDSRRPLPGPEPEPDGTPPDLPLMVAMVPQVNDPAVERLRVALRDGPWGRDRQTTDWPTREALREALTAAVGVRA